MSQRDPLWVGDEWDALADEMQAEHEREMATPPRESVWDTLRRYIEACRGLHIAANKLRNVLGGGTENG